MRTYRQAAMLDALGDPTRRAVLEILRAGPCPVGQLAARLPVSRPAVSQHLSVLKAAGLVRDEASGARRIYRIDPAGLAELRAYIEGYWRDVLAAFGTAVEAEAQAGRGARAQ